jgi:AraC family transcriptional regulator
MIPITKVSAPEQHSAPGIGTFQANSAYTALSRGNERWCREMKSLGNILRKKQIGPFRIIEKFYSPGTSLALHEHETAYVSFLLAGAYVERSRQEERICAAGTVIWHPRAEVHADRFQSGGGHLLDLEIDPAWLDDVGRDRKIVSQARMFCGGLPYSLGLRLYRELSADSSRVDDVATELLGFFFTGPLERHPPAWFNRALQICSDLEQQLSLASLAFAVGVHPVHVARSFRRFLGYTFGDHLAKIRIRNAFRLLATSGAPIVDVAYACGFADHAHLCRAFKRSTGLTPSAFRRNVHLSLQTTRQIFPPG